MPVVTEKFFPSCLSLVMFSCIVARVHRMCPEGGKKSSHTTGRGGCDGAVAGHHRGSGHARRPRRKRDPNRVLRHAVFFKFKESSTPEQVQEVVDAFRALPTKIDTIIDFQCGTNNSPEGLNDGFTHCFLLSFKDDAGRAVYLPHDAHKAFGDVLRPHMDKVFVVDYWGTQAEEKLGEGTEAHGLLQVQG